MRLAVSQQLFAYWDALRGARGAPERNDIEPGAIRGALGDTFILEFDSDRGFPFRIVGSRTSALFGRELRGGAFLDLWRTGDRAEAARIVESVADGAQPFLIGARGQPEGAAELDLEFTLLPLRHHRATHARLLGACAPSANPPWIGQLPLRRIAMTSSRALSPASPEGMFGQATDRPGFRRRGHLFVYSATP